MDSLERKALEEGYKLIAGTDEAGRGPLAGPVVSGAVIFTAVPTHLGIKDSKKLTHKKREALLPLICASALSVGVGVVWPGEVDKLNIHNASLLAMERAVEALSPRPDIVLVDGRHTISSLDIPQRAIISGDDLSITIAAASIVAKVVRDQIMSAYHSIFPEYNFIKHKGYPTREHVAVLNKVGPSPIHRESFSYKGKAEVRP